MAGYYNYSMSNNAVAAYENGERPLSKWTKKDIIKTIGQDVIDRNPQLKALKAKELKAIFLTQTAWHHTSKFYNETNFYACRTLQDIKDNPEDTLLSLNSNAPYPQPVAHVFASVDSPEAVKFQEDFANWLKKMRRLEDIVQAIADGDIK